MLQILNHYLTGMNNVVISIQTASGLYEKDKYVPLIQSAVNLIISIYLAKRIGLAGVFIGTIISTLIPLIVKPCIVYKEIFKEKISLYFKDFTIQTIIIVLSAIISAFITKYVNIENAYLNLAFLLLISIIIPGTLIILIYRKKEAYQNVISRVKHIFSKFSKKVRHE